MSQDVGSENPPPHLNLLSKSNLKIHRNRRKTLTFMPVKAKAKEFRHSLPLLDVTNIPLPSESIMKSRFQVENTHGPVTHYIGKKPTCLRRRVLAPQEPIAHPVPHSILKDALLCPDPFETKRVRFLSRTLSTVGDTVTPGEALNPESELSDTPPLVAPDVPFPSVSPVSPIAPVFPIAPVVFVSSVSPVDPVSSISLVAPIGPVSAISSPSGQGQEKFPVLRKAVPYALPLAKSILLIVVLIVTWKQLKWSFLYGPNAHFYSALFKVTR